MTDMPNTEYITINKDGVFVGGKPATAYRGREILFTNDIKTYFASIQIQNPNVQELHVGAFITPGIFAKFGNPSAEYGQKAWCRVKLSDGRIGPWVFFYQHYISGCESTCASIGCFYVACNLDLHTAVLGFAERASTKSCFSDYDLKRSLGETDLSKFVGKQTKLNGHLITIQKQK